MSTTSPLPTQSELEKMNKSDLQAKYAEVFAKEADETLTKAELTKAILNASDSNISDNAGDTSPLPTQSEEAHIPNGYLKVVKLDNGKVIDRSTMTKASWDLLPQHKYGWSIEKPSELN